MNGWCAFLRIAGKCGIAGILAVWLSLSVWSRRYPGHYDARIRPVLQRECPRLFVCGHSHILKVMYDRTLGCLAVNPGAAGKFGFHKVCTAVRFLIEKGEIKDLEVLEFKK